MITFTVNPSNFDDGESAYTWVRGNRYISRLMHLFGIRDYVCVFEVQKNGMPHWHVLFEHSGWLNFKRIHRLWKKWGIGSQVMVSFAKGSFKSPIHAIRYITKYLLKGCDWPSWVLNMSRLRVFSCSRSIGAFNRRSASLYEFKDTFVRRCSRRQTTIIERVGRCGSSVSVFCDGRFVASFDCDFALLLPHLRSERRGNDVFPRNYLVSLPCRRVS